MRKHIIIFLIALCCACSFEGRAQHWIPVKDGITQGSAITDFFVDTVGDVLYMAGVFKEADSAIFCPGVMGWNGTNYFSLGCGIEWNCLTGFAGPGPSVSCITEYHGDIYVGGGFTMAGGVQCNHIARWNGTTWDSVLGGTSNSVSGMRVINDELYVVGAFTNADGIPVNGLAKWNDTTWSDVHALPSYGGNLLCDVIEYNNELYVCGNFQGPGGIREIVRWNGTAWTDVGGGFYGGLAGVEQMCIFQNKLYVSGAFTRTENANNPSDNIAAWDGTVWIDPAGGTFNPPNPFVNGQIHDMVVFHNELWICGAFQCAGGVAGEDVAKWDGVQWCVFDTIGTFDTRPYALAVFRDSLFLGGNFWSIGQDSILHIAKFDGGNWVDTCGQFYLGVEGPLNNPLISVYPNPVSDIITFQFSGEQKSRELVIYDALGKEVWREETDESSVSISASQFAEGMYFYQVTEEGRNPCSGKFIKQ